MDLINAVTNVMNSYEVVGFNFTGNTAEEIYDNINFDEEKEKPDKDDFLSKVDIEYNKILMELLRHQRYIKLAECDWTQMNDVVLSNADEWKTYRQALRDLPSNVVPTSEDMDALFPTKPGQ